MIIINQTLNTGFFPDKLKIAKVTLVYKKIINHNSQIIGLFRFCLSYLKYLKRIICNQVYNFVIKEKLFYVSQYGFRTEHSTELAALEIVDKLITKIDNNETTINIYLDLSKAFDTIDHNILKSKLE